jgi:phenylalanyl-tRNA synthetase beta chain
MRITLSWLKDFLDTDATLDEILNKLTSVGIEVEGVTDRSGDLNDFIVAQIISTAKHPTADKLQVCKVFDGTNNLQIVCGASNARTGIKVVLAPIGAVIPKNGLVIKQSKIREIDSNGMLCSAEELSISGDSSGIIELPESADVGEKYIKFSGLDNPVIEVSITPNRGDCLGVYGIARDLAATGIGSLKNISQLPLNEAVIDSPIKVKIEPDSGCNRFFGRYFQNVKNNELSPSWISKNLLAIGCRVITPLVDITNIMCHSFARPMHVFDADKIKGDVVVRRAVAGEKFMALNDVEYKLDGGEIVISDESGVIALAGIIGGKNTACDEKTKNVFLEIALFDPVSISKTGRRYQIDTDSRYRFERKVDEGFVLMADLIACNLIGKICGGRYSHAVDVVAAEYIAKNIEYSIDNFSKRAGFQISDEEILRILMALGFSCNKQMTGKYLITVPSWRNDIEIKEDITEEILRIYGYDNIPLVKLPESDFIVKPVLSQTQRNISVASRKLASLAYNEVVSWSFMSIEDASLFTKIEPALQIENPISVELSYMRPSIIPNLISAIKSNASRGFDNLSLFEIGPIFDVNLANFQQTVCTGVRSGFATLKSVHETPAKYDVFDIKRDIFAVIDECGLDSSKLQIIQESGETPSWYHPAQSASLRLGKVLLGYFGKINPMILAHYDVDSNCYAFELFINNFPHIKSKCGKRPPADFSDYQAVKRDFAFILDSNAPAGSLIKIIESVDRKLIKNVNIFDCFSGPSFGENKKSIALSVTIQASDRTLVEEEIEAISKNIILEIKSKMGGVLRS